MKNTIITIPLLLLTMGFSFLVPKPKYESPDIFAEVDIPSRMPDWISKDVSGQLDIGDDRYRFISDIFARAYANTLGGEQILFFMLDAGNFHNPKVCFGASGYVMKDLPDISFQAGDKTFQAYAVYAGKEEGEGTLIIYWITINKKIVNWTEQKLQQFWFSLLNKQKVGLMVRIDIPTPPDRIDRSIRIAKRFVRKLNRNLSPDDREYVFGRL